MKIVIFGIGKTGSTIANELMDIANQIYIIDIDTSRMVGEISELNDASEISNTKTVYSTGNYKDTDGADFVIITAGVPRFSEQTTMDDLYKINYPIVKGILNNCQISAKNILIVTNPPKKIINNLPFLTGNFIPVGDELDKIRKKRKSLSGIEIVHKKGYTNWGIAHEVKKIVLEYKNKS